MADSSVSSFSSTSVSEDDRRSIRRKRKRKRRHSNDRKRHSSKTKTSTSLTPAIAAPSDWEQLRAHFQFVLPTDDHDNDDTNNNQKYGSNWQERMVKNYHAHLYKEYVLADLSRVVDIGKIGLRWRTEKEVADGRGFRSCGNLMCNKGCSSSNNTSATTNKDNVQDQEAYASAVKRHVGISVPENGGKVPLGVLLPTESTTSDALEAYLQSCADEQQQMMMNQIQHEHKKKKKKHSHDHKSKKHKRKHQSYSLTEQEKNEVARLESIPYGLGLHDYEVDFVYVEQQVKKRELVKVRLCLRCAPLLFIAKMGSSSDRKAPAVKAREARELAARNHASSMTNANVNNTNQSIDSSTT